MVWYTNCSSFSKLYCYGGELLILYSFYSVLAHFHTSVSLFVYVVGWLFATLLKHDKRWPFTFKYNIEQAGAVPSSSSTGVSYLIFVFVFV